jgi:hypothetical protein
MSDSNDSLRYRTTIDDGRLHFHRHFSKFATGANKQSFYSTLAGMPLKIGSLVRKSAHGTHRCPPGKHQCHIPTIGYGIEYIKLHGQWPRVRAVPASPLQHIVWVGGECDLRQGGDSVVFCMRQESTSLKELNI